MIVNRVVWFLLLFNITVWARKPVVIKDSLSLELYSKILKETVTIDVFIPQSYKKDQKKHYPVVYLTDSEYNFGGTSYITRRLIKNKDIPEVILVGVSYNTTYQDFYNKRARDLTPFLNNSKRFPQTGGADRFVNFYQKELFPLIQKKFRIDPDERTLYGHSFGGLFSHYVLLKYPKIFKRIISLSPSLWFAKRQIFQVEQAAYSQMKNLPIIFYSAVGGDEPKYFVDDWKRMNQLLKSRNYKNFKFRSELFQGENHRSVFGAAFTKGMRYVFGHK